MADVSVIKDDKRIVTDIAFGVSEQLLGKKLATPTQRGIAMLVDAFLVLLLTDLSGAFWGLFAGIAFYKFGQKREKKSWRLTRFFLRMLGGIVVFISVFVLFDSFVFNDDSNVTPSDENNQTEQTSVSKEVDSVEQLLTTAAFAKAVYDISEKLTGTNACDTECFHPEVQALVTLAKKTGVTKKETLSVIDNLLAEHTDLSKEQKQSYLDEILELYDSESETSNSLAAESQVLLNDQQAQEQASDVTEPADSIKAESKTKQSSRPVYSVMEYVKALIADLGLGFGWAALYFTAFCAWWRGQTPGKKLMGIRVVQLDGTYMSPWDSFGRYGGYGAGFATGLTGFMQIIWDANRQAIQDKISATVVIQGDL